MWQWTDWKMFRKKYTRIERKLCEAGVYRKLRLSGATMLELVACQMNLEIRTALIVLNSSWKQFSLGATTVWPAH